MVKQKRNPFRTKRKFKYTAKYKPKVQSGNSQDVNTEIIKLNKGSLKKKKISEGTRTKIKWKLIKVKI